VIEIWKRHPEFTDYEVSDLGRVRKVSAGKIKKQTKNTHGYFSTAVRDINKKFVLRTVHTLVLETFVGKMPKGLVARFIDGDRENVRLSNLKWGKKDWIRRRGEQCPWSRLTKNEVLKIRKSKKSLNELSAEYSVTRQHIHYIVTRQRWRHI